MQNIQKNNKLSTNPYPKSNLETKNKKNDAIEYFLENNSNFEHVLIPYERARGKIYFRNKNAPIGLSFENVEEILGKIKTCQIRICFQAKFFEKIKNNHYQNHRNLEGTENTSDFNNLMRRLKTEKELFNNNSIDPSIMKKVILTSSDLPVFLSSMLDLFEGDENILSNLNQDQSEKKHQDIVEHFGFEMKETSDPAPIYGLLQNKEDESIICIVKDDSKQNLSKIEKFYGKSALLLNDKFKNISTFCINDSFDSSPENFSIRGEKNEIKSNEAIVLCKFDDDDQTKILLENYLQSNIDYFECQIHTDHIEITKENITKIFISRSECIAGQLSEIEKICAFLGIPMEIVE